MSDWWKPGVGGPGEHPGCTCPMTGDSAAWHYDDCAAHDDDARILPGMLDPEDTP